MITHSCPALVLNGKIQCIDMDHDDDDDDNGNTVGSVGGNAIAGLHTSMSCINRPERCLVHKPAGKVHHTVSVKSMLYLYISILSLHT